jgi:uncharacterized membrane protein
MLPYYAVAAAVAAVVHQVLALLQLLVTGVQSVVLVVLRLVARIVLLSLGMVFGAWYERNRWAGTLRRGAINSPLLCRA